MSTISMQLHAIIIPKSDSSDPALYYNTVQDHWVKNFQLGCGFVNEEEARSKLKKINVEGAYIVGGTARSD